LIVQNSVKENWRVPYEEGLARTGNILYLMISVLASLALNKQDLDKLTREQTVRTQSETYILNEIFHAVFSFFLYKTLPHDMTTRPD